MCLHFDQHHRCLSHLQQKYKDNPSELESIFLSIILNIEINKYAHRVICFRNNKHLFSWNVNEKYFYVVGISIHFCNRMFPPANMSKCGYVKHELCKFNNLVKLIPSKHRVYISKNF